MSEHPELLLPPEDLLWLVPQIAQLRQLPGSPLRVDPADDIGYYGVCEQDLRDSKSQVPFWIGCRAGCQVIGIESNGNIKGCLSLPSAMHGEDRFVEGNLRRHRLEEIWRRPGAFAYNREDTEGRLGGFCAVCRYRAFCRGGCSWTAFGQGGEQSVEDCRRAHQELLAAGAREILAVTDVGQELVSAVQDPEGNPLGLLEIKRSR